MLISYLPKILLRNFTLEFLSFEISYLESYNPINMKQTPTPTVNPSITSGSKLNLEEIKNTLLKTNPMDIYLLSLFIPHPPNILI